MGCCVGRQSWPNSTTQKLQRTGQVVRSYDKVCGSLVLPLHWLLLGTIHDELLFVSYSRYHHHPRCVSSTLPGTRPSDRSREASL